MSAFQPWSVVRPINPLSHRGYYLITTWEFWLECLPKRERALLNRHSAYITNMDGQISDTYPCILLHYRGDNEYGLATSRPKYRPIMPHVYNVHEDAIIQFGADPKGVRYAMHSVPSPSEIPWLGFRE